MAADKDEGELLVGYFVDEVDGGAALARIYLASECDLGFVVVEVEAAVSFEDVESPVISDLGEPGLGVVWDSMERPMLQGLEHGVLYGVLGDGQIACAEDSREVRDHATELVAEEMVHEVGAWDGGFGGCSSLCHGHPDAVLVLRGRRCHWIQLADLGQVAVDEMRTGAGNLDGILVGGDFDDEEASQDFL